MSTAATKQKKPQAAEPNKKVKHTIVLRAYHIDQQRFFDVSEEEKAKQWLLNEYANYGLINDADDFRIERCITDGSEPVEIFRLKPNNIVWMNNERIVKQLQNQVPDQLTDDGVQKIGEFLEKSKLKLKLIKRPEDESDLEEED